MWGGELECSIEVSGNRVSKRTVSLLERRGGWHGARFSYGHNLVGCTRTVLEDEVCTALYGWGKGLPIEDEGGNPTGGYTRRLSFADANGGVKWVGDEEARERWGRWDADRGERVHAFGDVVFPECEDAAELLALTKAGTGARVGIDPKVGVISDKVFSDIASAIRQQNKLTVKYRPGEMTQAIRDLAWDVGLKPRALLLSDGTLEFNYLDGRQVKSGSAAVVKAWEVDPAGYSESGSVPWCDVRDKFTKVRISWDMAYVKVPVNMRYWFYAYGGVTEIAGLGFMRHVRDMSFCFSSCGSLASLDLRGFDPSELTDLGYAFASCAKLTTITVDPTWALPSGVKGFQTFYNDKALVGGNGTAFSSSKAGVGMCVVDKAGQAGYLTAG